MGRNNQILFLIFRSDPPGGRGGLGCKWEREFSPLIREEILWGMISIREEIRMKNREGEMRTEKRSAPSIGVLVRHLPTGIVGVVEKVYAPGEHPTATCEVVAFSTGDELVLKAEDFEELGSPAIAAFWSFLLAGLRNVVQAAANEAARRGVDPALLHPLFRAALADAFRAMARKN